MMTHSFLQRHLWNLATTRRNTNFIFFDADVFFQNEDWVENVMQSFEQNEIIHHSKRAMVSKDGRALKFRKNPRS